MATDAPNNQANDTAPEQTQKVTFNDEQQARVNELIRDAMGRAGREARQELAELKGRLEALQRERDAVETGREPHPEVEAMRHEAKKLAAERDAAIGITRDLQKQTAIARAASKVNFINTEIVTKLTADQVKYDDTRGRFIVFNEQGTERMNSAFEPMSLEEFYAEFGNKNSYLVRGGTVSGTGSSESQRSTLANVGKFTPDQIFGKNSNSALANKLAKEDMKEYLRLKNDAKQLGLI